MILIQGKSALTGRTYPAIGFFPAWWTETKMVELDVAGSHDVAASHIEELLQVTPLTPKPT